MKDIITIKKQLQHSKNINEINDILIEISKNPDENIISIIDFLFEILDKRQLKKINLNLVYLIGQVALFTKLDKKYINFLVDSYYESDRWVRNEIIQAFHNIVKVESYIKSINDVLEIALKEDYEPILVNSLKVFSIYKNLEESSIKSIFAILMTKNTNILNQALKVIRKEINNEQKLFTFLNNHHNYKILTKHIIRVLLIEFFSTISQLEVFKKKILNSNWEEKIKEMFILEIEILEKILNQKRS